MCTVRRCIKMILSSIADEKMFLTFILFSLARPVMSSKITFFDQPNLDGSCFN